ncbi:hypothetical protein ABCL16_003307 [Vibrio parahaemolyticus]
MRVGVIAEKPELGADIASTLSSNYTNHGDYIECSDINMVITWCVGGMYSLKDPEEFDDRYSVWKLEDLPMRWPLEFKPGDGKKALLNTIKRQMANCDSIVNACDIDSSGEAIFWEVYQNLNLTAPVMRVLITDNNLIAKSWNDLRDGKEFYPAAMAEIARKAADQIFGYNLTRALTCQGQSQGYQKTLTCGRVQTVMLALIILRERTIANFKPSDYFNITVDLMMGDICLKNVRYIASDTDPIDEAGRIVNKSFAEELSSTIKNQQFELVEFTNRDRNDNPPLPFDLGSLQAEASRKYGYMPDKVMKITQSLRSKKAITYNRTDSRYLTNEAHENADLLLGTLANIEEFELVISHTDPSRKTRAFNTKKVTAHHAIIPTINISKVGDFSDDEFNIYELIARNYIAQFLPPKVVQESKFKFSANGNLFSSTYTAVKQKGWSVLFDKDLDQDEALSSEEEEVQGDVLDISNINEGCLFDCVASRAKPQKTTPPPYYTTATFIPDLAHTAKYVKDETVRQMLLEKDADSDESGGIGTAATRTPIFMELFKKKFICVKQGKLRSTLDGQVIEGALPPIITTPEQTAIWAHQQKKIENGELSANEFLNDIHEFVAIQVEEIKKGINIPSSLIHEIKEDNCPTEGCNGVAKSRQGKTGEFYHCEMCQNNFNSYKGKIFIPKHAPCPKCTLGTAKQFIGKKGIAWQCQSEGCKEYLLDNNGTPKMVEERTCPKCKSSTVKRAGQNWMCQGSCGWIDDWKGEPVFGLCPDCEKPLRNYVIKKGPKKGTIERGCSDWRECGYKIS